MIEDVEIGLAGQAQEQSQFSSDELAGAGFEPESDEHTGPTTWVENTSAPTDPATGSQHHR